MNYISILRRIAKKTKRQKNKLTGVYCPLCGNYFKEFKEAGVHKRSNAECPGCGSRERHRLLYLYLKEKKILFDLNEPVNLLHFAPERCLYNLFRNLKRVSYYPCDLYPELYAHLKPIKTTREDITQISFKDKRFDVIMCNHVLEHIEEDRKALRELYRVMKPGGKGIFLVPLDESLEKTYEDFSITSPKEREKAFGQKDHVRLCGKDYLDRYREAGFKVNISTFGTNFSKRKRYKYGLLETEKIYLAEKN